jgi:hypothetical protein
MADSENGAVGLVGKASNIPAMRQYDLLDDGEA